VYVRVIRNIEEGAGQHTQKKSLTRNKLPKGGNMHSRQGMWLEYSGGKVQGRVTDKLPVIAGIELNPRFEIH